MMDNPKWRDLPVLCELHNQWCANRGKTPPEGFRHPFARKWEKLLADANLRSAEQRNEAVRDVRMLAATGLLQIDTVRFRPDHIQRITIPIEAEPRLRTLFPEFHINQENKFDPSKIDWQTEVKFLVESRVMVNPEDLLRLNAFFQDQNLQRPMVPIKERSLQIFGDEKRLDLLLGSALFRPDRLTLDLLKCEIVGEPFGWKRGPTDTGQVLVVENAATWHSYSRWNAQTQQFSAVVYGCGNRFADNIRHLADVLDEFSSPQRIFYFGDLDPQGLRIPTEAAQKSIVFGLPRVEPHLWSYASLLKVGQGKETPFEATEPVSTSELDWIRPLADPIRKIFDSGRRLAQEHIGWEFLSAFANNVISE